MSGFEHTDNVGVQDKASDKVVDEVGAELSREVWDDFDSNSDAVQKDPVDNDGYLDMDADDPYGDSRENPDQVDVLQRKPSEVVDEEIRRFDPEDFENDQFAAMVPDQYRNGKMTNREYDPDSGILTETYEDGTKVHRRDNDAVWWVNTPDGKQITGRPGEGTITTSNPDGSTRVEHEDGRIENQDKNGVTTTEYPTGIKVHEVPVEGGNVTTVEFPEDMPGNVDEISDLPDGRKVTYYRNGEIEEHNPNTGETTIDRPNGDRIVMDKEGFYVKKDRFGRKIDEGDWEEFEQFEKQQAG